jgi:hypothetical protein
LTGRRDPVTWERRQLVLQQVGDLGVEFGVQVAVEEATQSAVGQRDRVARVRDLDRHLAGAVDLVDEVLQQRKWLAGAWGDVVERLSRLGSPCQRRRTW